jgi:hypothetical protein
MRNGALMLMLLLIMGEHAESELEKFIHMASAGGK